jgi:hypothetical protein
MTSITEASPQELADLIAELEQYRERLVNETLETAQRAKVKKSQTMANLEPQLAEIDAHLQVLRHQQDVNTASN